jgi:arylsulfatase A-like enzyme
MPLTRRAFLPLAAAPALGLQRPARFPNIVVILADDQGWGDLSVHGNTNLRTPRIDSLARDGALFENFYVCSVCAPTRAEFLTGRYHPRGGVRGVTAGAERLNLDETTIAQFYKSAGYATGAFGKWHNGSQHPYHPNARGFDEYYGFTSGHWGQYFDSELEHNNRLVRGKGFIIDDLTNRALAFIEQNRSRPFFCYLPLNTPHSPMQVPESFYRRFAGFTPRLTARDPAREDLAMTRAALAMVENIDWNVGRVLDRIRALDLDGDTIVLYFSDNGPNSWRWNGGLRGRKGSLDEGGLRAPCLLRWKGRIPAGTRVSRIAGAIDLLPTFAALSGIPFTPPKPLDGLNLAPLLTGDKTGWPDRMIFTMQNRRASVRTQRYRLDPAGALFDIEADPMQDRNIAAEKPEVAARLRAALDEWTREMLARTGNDDRPYPVGHAAETRLPARDGVAHGEIKRSSIHPNCSFFTNWTAASDAMTWDIEVGRAGRYEALIHYACPRDSVGSTVELSFHSARVQAKIDKPWDPPLVGMQEDRAPRTESYVKDFVPLSLGLIDLPQGRGPLTLRALDVAGKQVAEIRYVTLILSSPASRSVQPRFRALR